MLFSQKLTSRVLPPEEVHPDLFKGANRMFKQVGKMKGTVMNVINVASITWAASQVWPRTLRPVPGRPPRMAGHGWVCARQGPAGRPLRFAFAAACYIADAVAED